MKSMFTIHAGEYLVGLHVQKSLKLNAWIPAKDTGIDLLVTDDANLHAVSLQVKYGKDFPTAPGTCVRGPSTLSKTFTGNCLCATRHSGPSTLFKYFFQAGYKWLAAETLYGPHEIILGALRGASRAYGQPRYGAHIAAQWSTSPHDDPRRSADISSPSPLRTFMVQSTFILKMDCGTWNAATALTIASALPARGIRRFTRIFIALPEPIAAGETCVFLWDSCMASTTVGPAGHMPKCGDRQTPSGILPSRRRVGTCSRCSSPAPCWLLFTGILVRTNRWEFLTGTPYGPADIVPIEANPETLSKYTTLVFLGWNTVEADQMERLRKYVEDGGHLILALPHISVEVRRKKLPQPLTGPKVRQLIGLEVRGLKASSGNWVTQDAAQRSSLTTPRAASRCN